MKAGDIYKIAGGSSDRDGVPALRAWLGDDLSLGAIQVDRHGNLVVAVSATNQIRVIAATTGRFYHQNMRADHIYTVAGSGAGGRHGHLGDGGPATKAAIRGPAGVAIDAHGNLVIADTGHGRIRVAAVTTGRFYGKAMTAGDIYTVAGGGTRLAGGMAAGKAFLGTPACRRGGQRRQHRRGQRFRPAAVAGRRADRHLLRRPDAGRARVRDRRHRAGMAVRQRRPGGRGPDAAEL